MKRCDDHLNLPGQQAHNQHGPIECRPAPATKWAMKQGYSWHSIMSNCRKRRLLFRDNRLRSVGFLSPFRCPKARASTASALLVCLIMAPLSQVLEPPANPERFSLSLVRAERAEPAD